VDRAARAIHALGRQPGAPDDWDVERGIHKAVALEAARAAIEAMRNPTEAMIEAARYIPHASDREIYEAMIDEALAEPTQKTP
jgi:hypothetical protein